MTLKRIPKEFARRFENELFREATIGVPDGRVWKIELKKSENEFCFCNKGWREFVRYYSISFGFFLVFKYEGNSQFSVVIFDASAAEIHYPCKDNSEKQNSESKCSGKRSSLNHCDYKVRRKRPKLEDQKEIIDIDGVNSRKHETNRSGPGRSPKMSKKQRAIEAAQNFKPENPSFTAIITPSNLIRFYMDVPITFSRPYLGKTRDSVKLQDCNGKRWAVNCSRRCSGVRMYGGWINFARANNLKKGDVCVFELIEKKKDFVFKVTIFAC